MVREHISERIALNSKSYRAQIYIIIIREVNERSKEKIKNNNRDNGGKLKMSVSNEELKQNVKDQLDWDYRIDASDIDVKADDGILSLEGIVINYPAKRYAENDALSIKGVNTVINNIKIIYPPSSEMPKDEELEKNAKDALARNANIDARNIDVLVGSGIITLEGSLDAYWKKRETERIISNLKGVVDVFNKLTIIPTDDHKDREIAENISNSLTRNRNVIVDNIDLKVKEGEVELFGSVSNWRSYEAAMDSVRYTAGVKNLIDHLKVKGLPVE